MAQKKLLRFEQIKNFPNVLEYPVHMQGEWKNYFKNNHPLVLELACGRGEYTVGLARLFPGNNYIGVDIKGNRMYMGAKRSLEEKMANAAFLRTQIERLTDYFEPGEVDEIWITFPDPHLRTSKAKKRLTHPRFLRLYNRVLTVSGCIHLKTDSPALYHFTKRVTELYQLPVVEDCCDVYAQPVVLPELNIKTHYESLDIAQSKKIHYLKFRLPVDIPDQDAELQEILKKEETND